MHLCSQKNWKATWFKAIVTLMAWNKSSYPSIYKKAHITAHFNMQHPQNASLSCQHYWHWIPDWGDCNVLSKMFFIYTPAPTQSCRQIGWRADGGGCKSMLQNTQLSGISCSRGPYKFYLLRVALQLWVWWLWCVESSFKASKKSCPSALAASHSPIYCPWCSS